MTPPLQVQVQIWHSVLRKRLSALPQRGRKVLLAITVLPVLCGTAPRQRVPAEAAIQKPSFSQRVDPQCFLPSF